MGKGQPLVINETTKQFVNDMAKWLGQYKRRVMNEAPRSIGGSDAWEGVCAADVPYAYAQHMKLVVDDNLPAIRLGKFWVYWMDGGDRLHNEGEFPGGEFMYLSFDDYSYGQREAAIEEMNDDFFAWAQEYSDNELSDPDIGDSYE